MGSRKSEDGNEKKENIHAGHRQRLRQQFLRGGGDAMPDHVLLELLLTYAIPRADVNPLSHRLLKTFGSLAGVFRASPVALQEVEGMGEGSTVFLKVLMACGQRCLYQYYTSNRRLDLRNLEHACRFALSEGAEDRYETLRMICLDSKYGLITTKVIDEGNTVSVNADPRRILEAAFLSNAHAFILTHNHPSGDVRPSDADIRVANMVKDAAKAGGLEAVDQLILGHGAVYSFERDTVLLYTSPTSYYTLTPTEYEYRCRGLSYGYNFDGFYEETF